MTDFNKKMRRDKCVLRKENTIRMKRNWIKLHMLPTIEYSGIRHSNPFDDITKTIFPNN